MRTLIFTVMALVVIGLANWAYSENYATQSTLREVDDLNEEIGRAREQLSVLRAEWAYLNRPERLRNLVDLNFEVLGLMPLSASHFGDADKVSYPPLDMGDLVNPVDLSAQFDGVDAEVPE